MLTRPRLLLRIEALALLVLALVIYWAIDGSWGLFFALVLVPDIGLLGYVAGRRIGAFCYNVTHFAALPFGLGVLAAAGGVRIAGLVSLIWIAHIGIDRALGLGLKYATDPKDTHLGRV